MTLPHLELADHPHERHGPRRDDEAWLAEQWSDEATRVLVVAGTRVRPVDGRLEWCTPQTAPQGRRVLLGEHEDHTHFAVIVDPSEAEGEKEEWVPIRGLLPAFKKGDIAEATLVFHAIGLAEWHHATRFCPRCAGRLESVKEGHELRCTECGRSQFPRTDPAVIMLVTEGEPGSDDERCLLGRNAQWPAGRYSTLAGFCEPGETLEDAVLREVAEEVGVRLAEVTYFGNQPWPLPASLMIGFTARAATTRLDVDGDEIEHARWFTREELRAGAEEGSLVLPGGVSISTSLIEHRYGGELPGHW